MLRSSTQSVSLKVFVFSPCAAFFAATQVYGLPTILLFKDGKLVEGSKNEGAISLDKLKGYLTSYGVEVVNV